MKHKPKTLMPKLRFPEFRDGPGWRRQLLGDLFTERQEGGLTDLPLLSLTDKDGVIRQGETNRRDNSSLNKSKYLRVVPGDVAYNTMRMWEGRSAYVGLEGLVSPAYTVCKPKADTHGLFFSYYFKTWPLIEQFKRYSQGLVKDTLNLKFEAFAQIPISSPQPAEQRKIADCLTSLDAWIAAEGRKLEALRAHKKGLMQELFPHEGETRPRLRFPEFRDAWGECTLGALSASISSGRDKNSPDGPFDLYGSTGVIGKTSNGTFVGTFLLVARVGANAGLLTKVNGSFGVTDNTLVLDLTEKKNNDFIFHYLDNFGLNRMIFGSGQPLITGGQLKALPILLPGESERERIAACLSSLDALVAAQSGKLDGLRTHKKGLMQQLFPSPEGM